MLLTYRHVIPAIKLHEFTANKVLFQFEHFNSHCDHLTLYADVTATFEPAVNEMLFSFFHFYPQFEPSSCWHIFLNNVYLDSFYTNTPTVIHIMDISIF